MDKTSELLILLGVWNCTDRHIKIIDEFVSSGETDCKKLLDKLGSWDNNDLKITEKWLKDVNNG